MTEPTPTPPRQWTPEGVAAIAGAVVLAIGLVGHAYVLDDHVKTLDAAFVKHLDENAKRIANVDDRFLRDENAESTDRAASDKRSTQLEDALRGISKQLDALQTSVDSIPHKH